MLEIETSTYLTEDLDCTCCVISKLLISQRTCAEFFAWGWGQWYCSIGNNFSFSFS